MRAPVSFARATKSQFSMSWPTLSGMKILPRIDHRHRDGAEHFRRQAFDDHVAGLRQRFGRHERDAVADLRQIAFRLGHVAHRDGREHKPGNAGLDAPRHAETDGAEARQSYL